MTMKPETAAPLPLPTLVESILFVASEPVPVSMVAASLEVTADAVEDALAALTEEYSSRGLKVLRIGDRVHLTSSPRAAAAIEKFLGYEHTIGLSRAALETLAILAYKQPLTRPGVDSIRGVNSESVLENLMAKGLVEETGRAEGPGRPILYGTTSAFLRHFGLGSMAELPPLELGDPDSPPEGEPPAPQHILKE